MLSSDFVLRRHGENSFLICVFLFFASFLLGDTATPYSHH